MKKYVFLLWLIAMVLIGFYLPWGYGFAFYVISGLIFASSFEPQGDYDFGSGIMAAGVLLITIVGAIGYLVGKFVI